MRRWLDRLLEEDNSTKLSDRLSMARKESVWLRSCDLMLVTMEVELAAIDGVEVWERFLDEFPTRIIIFSSLNRAAADVTVGAIQRGTIDIVVKPNGESSQILNMISEIIGHHYLH
ncbi:response regulator [Paenibacillus dakarensis]|uniref:response regulator n=1 Tax=Paenibacillus dakarensis TaxID=1527293 RepID=UPI0006D55197|nr:response regulator [Paenibacillus dakarensis]